MEDAHPKLSVIMPLYNAEQFVGEAIESILAQTYADFEFIIVNDASTDKSREIAASYRDERIKIIDNEENCGSAYSMNKGMEMAQGVYIARMDSDDISLPTRFEKQIAFMDAHPDIAISGTWVRVIGDTHEYVWEYETDPDILSAFILFYSLMAFPTIMIRKRDLESHGLYLNEHLRRAEDFDLWARASHIVKLSNIPEVLLHYRVHHSNTSNSSPDLYEKWTDSILRSQLNFLGINPTQRELEVHKMSCTTYKPDSIMYIQEVADWFKKLEVHNGKAGIYKNDALQYVLGHFWYGILVRSLGIKGLWRLYKGTIFSRYWSLRRKATFIIKYFVSKIST